MFRHDDDERRRIGPFRHRGHRRPITRRDFLAQGFLTGAAVVTSPSLFGLLKRAGGGAYGEAVAACNVTGGSGYMPFMCFDLAGGASIAGANVLVGGAQGQLDRLTNEGYLRMGLRADQRPDLAGMTNNELGLLFHSDSAMLAGIFDKLSIEARLNINGCVLCARSENDTGNNPHNPMYGINRAGANGDLVTLIGTEPSESGGNSVAPMAMIDPQSRPVKVDRAADVTGLVDTGKLVSLLNSDDAEAVMRAIENISEAKIGRMTETAIVEEIVRCGYVESTYLVENFSDAADIDPEQDDFITGQADSIFDAAEMGNDRFRKTAAVMKMCVTGMAGAGTVELGGYDYHDSTRTTGEQRDFIAGQCIGASLEYAHRTGEQLMLYVFSDGSVSSDGVLDPVNGLPIWKGDEASTASVYFLVYDPAGPPTLVRDARQQIGYFRDSGSVETGATRISNNVEQLAQAIVLNYMALHGQKDQLDTVLMGHGLGDGTTREPLIAFNQIRTPPPPTP